MHTGGAQCAHSLHTVCTLCAHSAHTLSTQSAHSAHAHTHCAHCVHEDIAGFNAEHDEHIAMWRLGDEDEDG